MSGRSGGRRGGRGGRGGRKPFTGAAKQTKKKKAIEDYFFYVGSSKQVSDYEITAEIVINHIKKTFKKGNDISESLRLLEEPDVTKWRPTLQ